MGLWDKLMALKDALNYGEELNNKELWKTSAVLVSISGFIQAVMVFVPGLQGVDAYLVDKLSNGVYAAVCIYNAYIHVATSKSIGLDQ